MLERQGGLWKVAAARCRGGEEGMSFNTRGPSVQSKGECGKEVKRVLAGRVVGEE